VFKDQLRMTRGSNLKRSALFVGAAALLAGLLAACGSSASAAETVAAQPRVQRGGTLTMSEGEQGDPDSILPFVTVAENTAANEDLFHNLLWPPLYSFGTPSSALAVNKAVSVAYPPVWSSHDTVVTVRLKPWRWSDGDAVTARDVTFYMNLLDANKKQWYEYFPGDMPDNIRSVTARGTSTIVFRLRQSYNPTWFQDKELADIVPMPQQSWDKISATSPDGNYDDTPTGARKVLAFLSAQSANTSTYATNPLWRVVDGPWKLKSYNINGDVVFVPNKRYSGPVKPSLSQFDEVSYTSDAAQFSSLLAGDELQVGYIPSNDFSLGARVQAAGYSVKRAASVQINFMVMNYNSREDGALFRQLYFRQALQHLVNEPGMIRSALDGTGGYLDYGPIPPEPPSPYESAIQKTGPYRYSPATARTLLLRHGWAVPKNGVASCRRPGTASTDCGAGVARGQKASISLVYDSGVPYMQVEMEDYESAASTAGIQISLRTAPFITVLTETEPGRIADSGSGPDMGNWGDGFAWSFGEPYASGGVLFGSGGYLSYPLTAGVRALIDRTHLASPADAVAAMRAYSAYLAKQLPVIWQPATYYEYAVSKRVGGVFFPGTSNILPQYWYEKR